MEKGEAPNSISSETLSDQIRRAHRPMPRTLSPQAGRAKYYDIRKPSVIAFDTDEFLRDRKYLSIKQTPTCLSYAGCPAATVRKQAETVAKEGWTLIGYRRDEKNNLFDEFLTERFSVDGGSVASSIESYLRSDSMDSPNVSGNRLIQGVRTGDYEAITLKYEDPWPIWAMVIWCGLVGKSLPDVQVQFESSPKLSLPAPGHILKSACPEVTRPKGKFSFVSRSPDQQIRLIRKRTHWGRKLYSMKSKPYTSLERKWAVDLIKKINAFLNGRPNPSWNKKLRAKLYGLKPEVRNVKTRSFRFIEVLKSCDGMFLQEWMNAPEQVWDWNRFDLTILKNLNFLLEDEFLDGTIPISVLGHLSNYALLKAGRNTIKSRILGKRNDIVGVDWNKFPADIDYIQKIYLDLTRMRGSDQTRCLGTAIQNRGMGNPPPIMKLQSKLKFIETVTTDAPPLSKTEKGLIWAGLDKMTESIPDSAFTGLATKASLSVKATACWEYTQKDGGTMEAISEIVRGAHDGREYQMTDLHTGAATQNVNIFDYTVGEYVFWACLSIVLHTPPKELRKAFLAVISDPGKARAITKAHASLKIVLDVVSHICVWPLHKVESSRSGVSEESHAWNLFNDMFNDEGREVFFSRKSLEKDPLSRGEGTSDTTWDAVFAYCADLQSATDYFHLEVGGIIGNYWMTLCGIPPVLRAVVNNTCFQPREVYFEATGCLKHLGVPTDEKNVRKILTKRGIFMGDPLTKVLLHVLNMLATSIPKLAYDYRLLSNQFSNPEAVLECWRGMLG